MATEIDFGYAGDLEELQNLVEQLTSAAQSDYADRVKDHHFDPSIIQIKRGQLRIGLEVEALEDGSSVYNLNAYIY